MAYSNNIPQATDRPNNSQPLILNNFAAIDTVVGINHVAFDDASGDQGKHKFVTMPVQVGAPGAAADELTLYSRTSAASGVAELAFERETGAITEFTAGSSGPNGWSILPSGVLMKWFFSIWIVANGQDYYATIPFAASPKFSAVHYVNFQVHSTTPGADLDAAMRSRGASATFAADQRWNFRMTKRTSSVIPTGSVGYFCYVIGTSV